VSVPAVRAEALRGHVARAAPAAAATLVNLLREVAPRALDNAADAAGRHIHQRDAAAAHAAQILDALLAVVAAAPLSATMLDAVGMAGLEVVFACIHGGILAAAAYESVSDDDTPATNQMYHGALRVLTELLGEAGTPQLSGR
jgi:plasmid stabilization system protein ParE